MTSVLHQAAGNRYPTPESRVTWLPSFQPLTMSMAQERRQAWLDDTPFATGSLILANITATSAELEALQSARECGYRATAIDQDPAEFGDYPADPALSVAGALARSFRLVGERFAQQVGQVEMRHLIRGPYGHRRRSSEFNTDIHADLESRREEEIPETSIRITAAFGSAGGTDLYHGTVRRSHFGSGGSLQPEIAARINQPGGLRHEKTPSGLVVAFWDLGGVHSGPIIGPDDMPDVRTFLSMDVKVDLFPGRSRFYW